MGFPHYVHAIGVVDGVNLIFYTPTPYEAGSAAVHLNGVLLPDTEWSETGPSSGQVTLVDPAPLVGDIIQIFYVDTVAGVQKEEIRCIKGVLSLNAVMLQGKLRTAGVCGELEVQSLTGAIRWPQCVG